MTTFTVIPLPLGESWRAVYLALDGRHEEAKAAQEQYEQALEAQRWMDEHPIQGCALPPVTIRHDSRPFKYWPARHHDHHRYAWEYGQRDYSEMYIW